MKNSSIFQSRTNNSSAGDVNWISSNKTAISVRNVSKMYPLYSDPKDRLRQSLWYARPKFLRSSTPPEFYKEFWALRDVSFEVKTGETVGIVGRNGSGKSTLLQIIAGTLAPNWGEVQVQGRVAALLELGSGFNPEFTGRDNVYLNGSILGLSREEMDARFDAVAAFADIGQFLDQPVKLYSSGMVVRLAFAVSIHVGPDILIIDEALAVGDMAFQAKCYKKFNQFKESGKTILFVTHSLDTIIRYCDQSLLLHEGKKVEEGQPKKVADVYKQVLLNSGSFKEVEPASVPNFNATRVKQSDWKKSFTVNPNLLEYGSKEAEIVDYGIFDNEGATTTNVLSEESCVIKMRVRFNESIDEPIFAFSIKDIKGAELVGTNTFIEHVETRTFQSNDEIIITFTQALRLQAGPYALSLGCTKYEGEGLVVFHRLYDVLLFEVISTRSIFGMFDVHSEIELIKL